MMNGRKIQATLADAQRKAGGVQESSSASSAAPGSATSKGAGSKRKAAPETRATADALPRKRKLVQLAPGLPPIASDVPLAEDPVADAHTSKHRSEVTGFRTAGEAGQARLRLLAVFGLPADFDPRRLWVKLRKLTGAERLVLHEQQKLMGSNEAAAGEGRRKAALAHMPGSEHLPVAYALFRDKVHACNNFAVGYYTRCKIVCRRPEIPP
jgi:hypothetical protein